MVGKNNSKNFSVKRYIWLFMAVICIVFSSASKKIIEQKVDPAHYSSALSFNKRLKDGCRDRHEYLTKVVRAGTAQTPGVDLNSLFVLSALISLVLLSLYDSHARLQTTQEQPLALAGPAPLYLQHHRLQV